MPPPSRQKCYNATRSLLPIAGIGALLFGRYKSLTSSTNIALDLFPLPLALATRLFDAQSNLQGWCPEKKALWLASLVLQHKVSIALEIGIFGGRSMIPIAMAMQYAGHGEAYGIEPWSNAVATENEKDPGNLEWWSNVDLVGIKKSFLEFVCSRDLVKYVKIIEAPSDVAQTIFNSDRFRRKIELLHVDGAHNEEQALRDVKLWTEFVADGGIVVLDDITWPSVIPAKEYMDKTYEKLDETIIPETNEGFATYRITRR